MSKNYVSKIVVVDGVSREVKVYPSAYARGYKQQVNVDSEQEEYVDGVCSDISELSSLEGTSRAGNV